MSEKEDSTDRYTIPLAANDEHKRIRKQGEERILLPSASWNDTLDGLGLGDARK